MCFKIKQMSTQRGIKKYGEKRKVSAMKEMRNVEVKNEFFSKVG